MVVVVGGSVNLHLIECCLGGKSFCKLIWLNAKIGHALKKDESEMKALPAEEGMYVCVCEREKLNVRVEIGDGFFWRGEGDILRKQKPKQIVEIFQVVT